MQKLKWTTVQRKVKDLIPLDYNPRKLDDKGRKKLAESLDKFDLVEIPVIDRDNSLVAGNQRVTMLMDAGRGEELIDVRCPNRKLTETELKEYNILSNTHVGIWDVKKLEDVFNDVDIFEIGVDKKEIQAIRRAEDLKLKVKDDEFKERKAADSFTKEGDLYELTNKKTGVTHRILCGDTTKLADMERLTGGAMMDVVVSDPPYNVDYEGQKGMKIENDNMDDSSFYQFLFDVYTNFNAVLKKGGCLYISHADSEGLNFRKAFVDAGFMLKQCLIWVKNSAVMGRQDYNWKHEPILFGWKPGAAHYFIGDFTSTTVLEKKNNISQMTRSELVELIQKILEEQNDSVLRIKRPSISSLHPTMKPIELWSKLIINSSKLMEKVLDGFLGSGTALISAEQTGRICYGMELTTWFCDEAVRRWITYMEKTYGGGYDILLNGNPLDISDIKTHFLKTT